MVRLQIGHIDVASSMLTVDMSSLLAVLGNQFWNVLLLIEPDEADSPPTPHRHIQDCPATIFSSSATTVGSAVIDTHNNVVLVKGMKRSPNFHRQWNSAGL